MYHALLSPVLALMVLTFLVWCCMYYLRLSYVMKNRIHPNKLGQLVIRFFVLRL